MLPSSYYLSVMEQEIMVEFLVQVSIREAEYFGQTIICLNNEVVISRIRVAIKQRKVVETRIQSIGF